MKNKTVLYLAKNTSSAALKRAAIADFFGNGEIDTLDSGKPVVTRPQGYFVSLSHSGEVICLVFSDLPVGVDIEEFREIDFEKIKNGFFAEKDRERIVDGKSFFEYWVKKEAESKLCGEGVFRSRKKELSAVFTSLSDTVSAYAGRPFSGMLASSAKLSYTVKEL